MKGSIVVCHEYADNKEAKKWQQLSGFWCQNLPKIHGAPLKEGIKIAVKFIVFLYK
jgi:hypothetical protein